MKKMKVRFSLSIISEGDLEMEGHQELPHPQPELEDKDIEDSCFYDDDQMLVSLANMSFNLVVDQDPDTAKPLCSSDCQFNEIVVMSEQADLAFSKKYLISSSFIRQSSPLLTNVEVAIAFLLFLRNTTPFKKKMF